MINLAREHVCMTSSQNTITLRSASPADARAIARLAQLDSRPLRDAQYLLAEDGDQLMAAMSMRDGSAIADPFQLTTEAVALLRNRREQLLAPSRGHARRRLRFPARHTAARVA